MDINKINFIHISSPQILDNNIKNQKDYKTTCDTVVGGCCLRPETLFQSTDIHNTPLCFLGFTERVSDSSGSPIFLGIRFASRAQNHTLTQLRITLSPWTSSKMA